MWFVDWVDGELKESSLSPELAHKLILNELYGFYTTYQGWQLVEPEEAMATLLDGNLFVFVGHSVMCLSASRPWFSAEHVVSEEFVGQGMQPADVVAILRAASSMYGCKKFVVGTRAVLRKRHAGLSDLYQREGMTVSAIELMGEVHG